MVNEAISAIAEAVVALAAAAAAVAAWKGLRTWQNELYGRADYELARRLLLAAYAVRDGFAHVRNRLMFSSEYPDDPSVDTLNTADRAMQERAMQERFAYTNRWRVLADAIVQLETEAAEARVLWGADASSFMPRFRNCAVALELAIRTHLEGLVSDFSRGSGDEYRRSEAELRDHEGNRITTELEAAVAAVEKLVEPHLRRHRRESARARKGGVK